MYFIHDASLCAASFRLSVYCFFTFLKETRRSRNSNRIKSWIKRFCWWLSRGHTHELIVRISNRIRLRVLFTFGLALRFPVYQLREFSFISFYHFAPWIKKKKFQPKPHHAFSRCWSFLRSFASDSSYPIAELKFLLWKTEMKLDTCWWWWGLMKWFLSTSFSIR